MKPQSKVISIINEEINLFETDVSNHAYKQIDSRLNEMTAGADITPEEEAEIRKNLNLILSNEFDSKDYGIFLGSFKPNPNSPLYTIRNSHDPGIPFYQIFDSNDKLFKKDSTGDEMWAIVRKNVLQTVMLRKSVQRRSMHKGRNDDGGLGVDEVILNLETHIENEKKKREQEKLKSQEKQNEKQKIMNVEGVLWVIDAQNQKLFKKNNPQISVSFDEIHNHPAWNEKTQDAVFNTVVDYLDTQEQK